MQMRLELEILHQPSLKEKCLTDLCLSLRLLRELNAIIEKQGYYRTTRELILFKQNSLINTFFIYRFLPLSKFNGIIIKYS